MSEICNRKAYYDYFIERTLECGIALRGNEVKSIRDGSASIKDAWCTIQNGNLVLRGMHISKWKTSNVFDIDEDRERQLLIHRSEIRKLQMDIKQNGLTIVPIKVYFKSGKCKVEIAVCRGKHNYDKRESIKARDVSRDIQRYNKNN